ncbi:MAG: MBL fold metallo-hydrolase [Phycisphaerales bacterium]|nr:MBL fold metallo-hydrolase [Phycisphaerales bacterium]
MSAFVCVLGSSSRGNATAISFDDSGRFILVDAGLTPKRVRGALVEAGASARFHTLRAIFLTHLDRDHWSPSWAKQLQCSPVPVILRRAHAEQAIALGVPAACLRPIDGAFRLGETAEVRPIAVPHDEIGSTAFRFDCDHASIGHATDLGHVTAELLEAFRDLDMLSIESNYDEALQRRSSRPESIKERIMGGRGHLSNEQSVEAARLLTASGTVRHLVLLHLSQECNRPQIVRDLFCARLPAMAESLVISRPNEPTPLLQVRRREAAVA